MLKKILSITGKPGLYRLVSRGNNMLIVESLLDGRRLPTHSRDKIVSLGDISMFTDDGDDVPLSLVLNNLKEKAQGGLCTLDLKNSSTSALQAYFAEVLPNFDRERVYPSDIRKLITWYNLLVKSGLTDFSEEIPAEQPTESEA